MAGGTRFKEISGVMHKKCNGPLHEEGGEFMPVNAFWTHKSGQRAGKLFSRCAACERLADGRIPQDGLIAVSRIWFIFVELRERIGKAETCRRLGISMNMWYRVERGIYKNMYRKTARAALLLLRELRMNDTVRHPDSIKYGAARRGREEKKARRSYVDKSSPEYNGNFAERSRQRWANDSEYIERMDEVRAFNMQTLVPSKSKGNNK